MAKYIVISERGENPVSYSIDTEEERTEAAQALLAAGEDQAAVHVGDPEDPSSYASGEWFRVGPGERNEIHNR
jgi:hypothetical protein